MSQHFEGQGDFIGILSGPSVVTNCGLAGRIGDLVRKAGIELPIDSDKVRKLSRPLTFSCEKAKKVLGYEAVETLEEGIRREVEWLKGMETGGRRPETGK